MGMKAVVMGLGFMGNAYIEMLRESPLVSEVIGIDIDEAKREMVEKKYHIKCIDSIGILNQADVVFVCTPTPYHKDNFHEAKRISENIVIEKPLALDIGDAGIIKKESQTNGYNILCSFVERYNQPIRELGNVSATEIEFRRIMPVPRHSDWYKAIELSGGPLLDLGVHDFDLAEWITKNRMEITNVSEDNGIYTIEGISNTHLRFIVGWSNERFENSIRIGDDKFLDEEELGNRYPPAYSQMIDSFLTYFLNGTGDVPTAEAGFRTMEHVYKAKKLLL